MAASLLFAFVRRCGGVAFAAVLGGTARALFAIT
jgi:hypothetical protein